MGGYVRVLAVSLGLRFQCPVNLFLMYSGIAGGVSIAITHRPMSMRSSVEKQKDGRWRPSKPHDMPRLGMRSYWKS